jgi:ribose 5-phosphate isomerase A
MKGENDGVKRRIGAEAVDRFVTDGLKIGLGTGSTAIWVVRRVAERFREGRLPNIKVVTTSLQSDIEARSLGLPVLTLNDAALAEGLDLTIDGADEIDTAWNLIKGGGGALLMEKIVTYASRRFIVVAEESKLSERLCEHSAIPVEIIPAALVPVMRTLRSMGAEVSLRIAVMKAGPVVTDHGNLLLDATFRDRFDAPRLEIDLKGIPGVLENGLFTRKKPELLLGRSDGRVEHLPG